MTFLWTSGIKGFKVLSEQKQPYIRGGCKLQFSFFQVLINDKKTLVCAFRGGSRAAATSKMERFVIIVNG